MAYRVNAHFTDASCHGWLGDVIAAPTPKRGDIITVNRNGRDIPLQVTAIWTPSQPSPRLAGIVMIEARENISEDMQALPHAAPRS